MTSAYSTTVSLPAVSDREGAGRWDAEGMGVSMESTDIDDNVLQALESRRSMARVKHNRPSRELVEKVIAAAAWAPNHFKTEPWRFAVVSGRLRAALGAVMEESLRAARGQSGADEGDPNDIAAAMEKERNKPLRAPIVIAVAAIPSQQPKVVEEEELAAVAAGVQNMLLAAEAVGLGAMWRTGKPAYDSRVKEFLGFPKNAHIVAFVYLGYPDLPPQRPRTRSAAHHTNWLGWE
jgi:nitroreductase